MLEMGSNFLACVQGTNTVRNRYSFYNIKLHFICNWFYNLEAGSPEVGWVLLKKFESYIRIHSSGRAY